MGSKACYAVAKATAGKLRSGNRFQSTKDGVLRVDRSSLDFIKWTGTAYIFLLLILLVSLFAGWKLVIFTCLALFAFTYVATAWIIVSYVCLSEHEDDLEDRYTWKTGWTVFKRINTIMYFGFTLWFKNELKMM